MKHVLQFVLITLLAFNLSFAQKAKIVTEAVTSGRLTQLGLTTNSVSTGLNIVPNQTFVYLSAKNIGNSDTVQTATFTLLSKPSGSTVSLTNFGPKWVYFKPDVKGEYEVKLSMATATGSHDTTQKIVAADFVGVGNFEGVAGSFPKCMFCHGSAPKFTAIYDKWKVSGHAQRFKKDITTLGFFSTSCMKCHVTGYDYNIPAANNGFDDLAASLGWVWAGPPNPGKWDTLKTQFPNLVNHATINCESCHGPGSEHSMGGATSKIQITLESGACQTCHNSEEYENSLHSEALWSNSFAQGTSSQNNSLGNCIRCHDAKGFVNFTNNTTTNTTGWTVGKHTAITCATCHDPHGNTNEYSLRKAPAASDTLGNGYAYTLGGAGKLCMSCHKARRNVTTYVPTTVTSTWGPHHSVQADVFFGKNAAEFNGSYQTSAHMYAVENACVDCHMAPTDTAAANKDKVGGHSMKLHNSATNFDLTKGCVNCHGPKASFESFMAVSDHDGDGNIESIRQEVAGLIQKLAWYLPPENSDSVSWSLIAANNNLTQKKAYWNYMLIAYDGSLGMHNTKFAIDVLTKSIIAIGGVVPVELTSFNANISDNVVSLNWETSTETNNKGFEVERKVNGNWSKIGYVSGFGTTTELHKYSFTDKLPATVKEGKVIYRLKQIDFDGTYQYSKETEVSFEGGPKEFKLSQNYPNPFNPTTTIKYSLPYDSKVKVVVYNLAGEVVKTLVNTTQGAGNHETQFSSNGLSTASGIYFYSIEAVSVDGSKNFKETKKMVLIK